MVYQRSHETRNPGAAANTAYNLALLGCCVHTLGVVGRDTSGDFLRTAFLETGKADISGLVDASTERETHTYQKLWGRGIGPHSPWQQVMRLDTKDQGVLQRPLEQRLLENVVRMAANVRAFIVCDYSKGCVTKEGIRAVRESGVRLLVADSRKNLPLMKQFSVLVPNEKELLYAVDGRAGAEPYDGGELDAAAFRLAAMTHCDAIVNTCGEHGMRVYEVNHGKSEDAIRPLAPDAARPEFFIAAPHTVTRHDVPTLVREVFDVTGAGDTATAALTLSMAAGASLVEAARIANAAAGVVVQKPRTATCSMDELRSALQEFAAAGLL